MSRALHYICLLAAAVALAACGDATGPDLTAGPYLFRSVAAASSYTCGLRGDSTLLCWGGSYPRVPTRIQGAPRFDAISSGWQHSCALTADGAAYCWGWNEHGQLGDGTTEGTSMRVTDEEVEVTLTAVSGAHRFSTISAGWEHTCGITLDGTAYCWGGNFEGQLGDGTTDDRLVPTPVSGGHAFVTVAAGSGHSCAVTDEGAAYCWGGNGRGELGDGSTTARAAPARVAGDLRFAVVSAGSFVSCGLADGGRVHCWGVDAYIGSEPQDSCEWQPGFTTPCSKTPAPVDGALTANDVAAGGGHLCAVAEDGTGYCWGSNYTGQLGDGTTQRRETPTPVAGSIRFATLSAGDSHTCGVTPEGVLYCWGDNRAGELGDGSTSLQWTTPIVVWGW
jgi:alpha-tubulin suppressor-like RCC1 family protein